MVEDNRLAVEDGLQMHRATPDQRQVGQRTPGTVELDVTPLPHVLHAELTAVSVVAIEDLDARLTPGSHGMP